MTPARVRRVAVVAVACGAAVVSGCARDTAAIVEIPPGERVVKKRTRMVIPPGIVIEREFEYEGETDETTMIEVD